MAELARVTNEAINTRASFMTIAQNAGNFNSSRINSEDINPIKSILDLENMDKNDNLSVSFVDGKLTFNTKNYETGTRLGQGQGRIPIEEEYQYGESSWNSDQMLAALPTKNLETDAMILEGTNNFTKQGINDGRYGEPNYFRNTDGSLNQFAFDDEKNTMAGEITKEVFQDIEGRRVAKMGMPSFRMALRHTSCSS